MRPGSVVVGAVCILTAARAGADEFKNPQVIEVRAPGGDLTIRARRARGSIPGLGEVEQVYGYDVRRGTSFPRESAGRTDVGLMPSVISVARGSTLRILYRNELLTADVVGK